MLEGKEIADGEILRTQVATLKVKVLEKDDRGRIRLSHKVLLPEPSKK